MQLSSIQETGNRFFNSTGSVSSSSGLQTRKIQEAAGALAKVMTTETHRDSEGYSQEISHIGLGTVDLKAYLEGMYATDKKNSFGVRCARLWWARNGMASHGCNAQQRSGFTYESTEHDLHAACAIKTVNEPKATVAGQSILNSGVAASLIHAGFNTAPGKVFQKDQSEITHKSIEKELRFYSSDLGVNPKKPAKLSLDFLIKFKEVAQSAYIAQYQEIGPAQSLADHDQLVHRAKMLLIASPAQKLEEHHSEVPRFVTTLGLADYEMRHLDKPESTEMLRHALVSLEGKLLKDVFSKKNT